MCHVTGTCRSECHITGMSVSVCCVTQSMCCVSVICHEWCNSMWCLAVDSVTLSRRRCYRGCDGRVFACPPHEATFDCFQ